MSKDNIRHKNIWDSFWSGLTGRHKTVPFGELGITSEYHCHILPGVDDGARTVEESITILSDMIRAGYRHVRLTPHMNPDIFPDNTEELIRKRYEAFASSLPEEIASSLSLSLGGEYMITPGFHGRDAADLLPFDEGKILIEMSYMYPSRNLEDAIFNITSSGYTPVLAHPERYLYMADRPDKFERYREMGCEFQLNILSLKGVYGPASEKIMDRLLAGGMYTYMGSDTHTPEHFRHILNMEIPSRRAELVRSFVR